MGLGMVSKLHLKSRLWCLGFVVCCVVVWRDPEAIALASTLTDCADSLDQEGETYVLSGNVAGSCTITADNITLDGLGLYSVGGSIGNGDGDYTGLTVKDLVSAGSVLFVGSYGGYQTNSGDGGSITLVDSAVTGNVTSTGGHSYYAVAGNGGAITITNSNIEGNVASTGGDTYGSPDYSISGNGGNITITTSTIDGTLYSQAGASENAGGPATPVGEKGDIFLTDSTVAGAVLANAITLVDNEPTITLVGDNPLEIEFAATYEEPGAMATDAKDGDLTADIVITGTVGSAAGDYTLTYTVEDSGTLLNWLGSGLPMVPANSTSTTRTITRAAGAAVAETPASPAVTSGSTLRGRISRLQQSGPVNQDLDRLRVALQALLLQLQNLLSRMTGGENWR